MQAKPCLLYNFKMYLDSVETMCLINQAFGERTIGSKTAADKLFKFQCNKLVKLNQVKFVMEESQSIADQLKNNLVIGKYSKKYRCCIY